MATKTQLKPIFETRSIRVRVGWRGNCLNCGDEFTTAHSNRKTCSGKCRVALHRFAAESKKESK